MINKRKLETIETVVVVLNIIVGLTVIGYNVYSLLRDKNIDEKRRQEVNREVWEISPEFIHLINELSPKG